MFVSPQSGACAVLGWRSGFMGAGWPQLVADEGWLSASCHDDEGVVATDAVNCVPPTIKAIDSRMFVPAQQSARSSQSNRHLRMADSVRPETHGQTSERSKSLKWIVCNNSIVILPVIQIFGQYLIASGFACGGYHHCVIKLDIVPSLDFQGILHGNGIGSDHL